MAEGKRTYLDFEKSVATLETKIDELSAAARDAGATSINAELGALRDKAAKELARLYSKLDAWQKTQVARHPDRPHFRDFAAGLLTDWVELSGDRNFGDDQAILGGMGRFRGRPVLLMGHEKGRNTQERLRHNFGMAMPEGYRKAIRLMDLAERFNMPVITLVDTAGAFPGLSAEERGQAEAIARSTERCLTLGTPLVSVIVGEGGSGGAIALAAANKVVMMEHAIYSVISPEGCASILWRDPARARDAAEAMKVTAQDLLPMRVIDAIAPEPLGGAHRDAKTAIANVGAAIAQNLKQLNGMDARALRMQRRERFLAIGRTGLESSSGDATTSRSGKNRQVEIQIAE